MEAGGMLAKAAICTAPTVWPGKTPTPNNSVRISHGLVPARHVYDAHDCFRVQTCLHCPCPTTAPDPACRLRGRRSVHCERM